MSLAPVSPEAVVDAQAPPGPCGPPVVNPIACENTQPGNPSSEWDITGSGDSSIQGFATDISVDQGQTVRFKVNSTASAYRLDIYRLGYYGGLGARKVATISPSVPLPQSQPACLSAATTGLIDCGNWAESASWAVPSAAVSGIYFAKLVRESGPAGSSHIVFVVRDDDGQSDVLFQTSDTTWQAYNSYGGNSLYEGSPAGRAYKVSYNRPFNTRANNPEDWVFNAEYPMVRWLEANGYHVSYSTGIDTDRRGTELLEHKVFLSVGHDEYWSAAQRANVETARGAGVHLAFLSGNEIFWKTRWENSIDGSGTPYRTLVSYKETEANAKIDPSPAWTGTWRDPRFSPPADGGRPENALSGTIFTVNDPATTSITVPEPEGKQRLWRNTSVATLAPGQTATFPSGTLGYEWDEDLDNGFRPPGTIRLSSTTVSVPSKLLDYGSTYGPGTATHNLTLYRHGSGALVFGAGTVQWSWGLDAEHDRSGTAVDVRMQQATVNLFADMGVQPATLQAGLVAATASTDGTAPMSTITSPAAGSTLPSGTAVTITGTAADTGGVVGGVEVSVDGGVTWHPALGRQSWSYSWTPSTTGAVTLKSRAADDSGNVETPSAGVSVTVGSSSPCSSCTIWSNSTTPGGPDADFEAVEIGVRFRASVAGSITGLRFYKFSANSGTHVGNLWSNTGTKLASVTFTNETTSGWQQMSLASPVAITANTTYVASYHTNTGRYAYNEGYFASTGVTNGLLQALADGVDGANGVYQYGSTSSFPTETWLSSNYWVDVVFAPSAAADTTPPNVSAVTPVNGSGGVSTATTVTATFSEAMDPATITTTTFELRDPANTLVAATVTYNSATRTATLTPTAALANSTTYTATVKGGATDPRPKDLAGNALASNVTWSFTTVAGADTTPPTVTAVAPASGATGVSTATTVTATFSEAMDATTITTSTFELRDPANTLVTATVTYNSATRTATLTPAAALANSTTYTATVKGGGTDPRVKDLAGNALASNFTWSFTTAAAADTTPPTVTLVSPASGATGVSTATTVTATFSEAMDPATITTSTFELRDPANTLVAAAVTYNSSTNTATLTPGAVLANATTYTASVKGGPTDPRVKDLAGNALAATFTWSFTTEADTTPPTVMSVTPATGATGITVGVNVTATFSEAMTASTIDTTTFELRDQAGALVSAAVTYDGATRTATLNPTADLANSTTYTATVKGGTTDPRVKDLAGNALAANFTWSFTTAAAFGCPCSIWSSSTTPAGADPDKSAVEVGIKFRAEVDGFITALRYFKFSSNTGTHVGHLWTRTGTLLATVTYTGETASGWQQVALASPVAITANTTYITSYHAPNGRYAVNSQYFATAGVDNPPLHALANGVDGGQGVYEYGPSGTFPVNTFNSENYWVDVVFTPGAAPDTTPPTITSVSPAAGATGVGAGANVTATFSEAMTASTINTTTFELRDPASALVSASVTYDSATRTATLDPTSNLTNSTTYTATVKGGATDPRVKDSAGNALASNFTWSFTTAAVADTTPPTVTAVTPAAGATGISVGANATATFSEAMTASTINTTTFELRDPAGALVSAAVTYDSASLTATLNPTADLANSTTYTVTVKGGATDPRVKDLAGNALAANFTWSFTTVADTTPPTVTSVTPASGATGIVTSVNVTATFSEAMTASTINTTTFELRDQAGASVSAAVTYDGATRTATLNPTADLANSTTYTATVKGGATDPRVKDLAGNALASNFSWSFTTAAAFGCPCSIWSSSTTPAGADPDTAVEVGIKFRADADGFITALRFYKFSANTGTHVGHLWTRTGTLLATATYTGETASGWQQVNLASAVAITANTTYITSYHAPNGNYALNSAYFATSGVNNPPLRALADGVDGGQGVYAYGPSGTFPVNTWDSSNYWVDVVFTTSVGPDTTPPTVTSVTPANGATGVSASANVTATFSEAMDATTITTTTFELRDPAGALVSAAVTYDGATRTATLNPSADLAFSTTYTATVKGGAADPRVKDSAGNALASNFTWSFTTAAGPPPPSTCPCSIWSTSTTPAGADGDTSAVEIGIKFRADSDGYITALRFYKFSSNTGTHVGHLWTRTGTLLATATYTGETALGWQQVTLASPVAITANTTYITSYHAPGGRYAVNSQYFASAGVDNAPLHALANGVDGGQGVYAYGASGTFPVNTYNSENYWVDVVFTNSLGPDTTPPTVTSVTPAGGTIGVVAGVNVTATFNEAMSSTTINTTTFELRDPSSTLVPATVTYDGPTRTATLDPTSVLAYSTTYTATIKGGATDPRAKDLAGNALASNFTWSFTTAAPPPPPPTDGPGGPILVVSSTANPYSRYYAEILRAEGLNEFAVADISSVSATTLSAYDVVILGELPLTAAQVTMFSDWVNAGGNLICMRPDKQLAGLLGLTDQASTLANGYLLVDGSSAPGGGIVTQTIQFHGTADRYALAGATAIATLYTNAATASANPAVTLINGGVAGGQAAAFTYDLARSIVNTRQGNPAWAGQERDGNTPIRPDDLFFGAKAGDVQPDWIDLNKVAIPQADEQQRLLANLILHMNRDRKPLPRLWYFPRGHKAVVIMTGDDHATGGTAGRFDAYKAASPPGCSVANWECVRSTSYIYTNTPLSDAVAAAYTADGFEIGLHVNTNCANWTPATLQAFYSDQLNSFATTFPSVPAPRTHRVHCIAWSDYVTQPQVELARGIRLDTNYYYFPASWVADRPGLFTGSGIPMRFADTTGALIDVYQATTQMTDESLQSYPLTVNALLDKAIGPEGYYGAFTANMHTDFVTSAESDAIVASAQARAVPIIAARQLLDWLDARNGSSFSGLTWNGSTLSFAVAVGAGGNGLQAMVPTTVAAGALTTLTISGNPVSFTRQTIKGIEYAIFTVAPGTYQATYAP